MINRKSFKIATIVCISQLIPNRNEDKIKALQTVLNQSLVILKYQQINRKQLIQVLDTLEPVRSIQTKFDVAYKLWHVFDQDGDDDTDLREILQSDFESLEIQYGWNSFDSRYLWYWMHIVAIYIDCHHGSLFKEKFILFIRKLIGCVVCLNHYINNINGILESLKTKNLATTLIAFHEHVSKNRYQPQPQTFSYNDKLVNEKYVSDYFNIYLDIYYNNVIYRKSNYLN